MIKRERIVAGALGATILGGVAFGLLTPANAERCALVIGGRFAEFRVFEAECPPDPLGKPSYKWLPAPVTPPPAHDPETQVLEVLPPLVAPDAVTDNYNVRAKTAQEIDTENQHTMDAMNRAVIKALCHLKNEVRTKVDSLPAWTQAQCLAAFKSLL